MKGGFFLIIINGDDLFFTTLDSFSQRHNATYTGTEGCGEHHVSKNSSHAKRGEAMKNDFEPLLDRKSAAKYLSVAPGTLAIWDCTKRYDLRPIKVGRAVRYRRADLDRFLEERLKP